METQRIEVREDGEPMTLASLAKDGVEGALRGARLDTRRSFVDHWSERERAAALRDPNGPGLDPVELARELAHAAVRNAVGGLTANVGDELREVIARLEDVHESLPPCAELYTAIGQLKELLGVGKPTARTAALGVRWSFAFERRGGHELVSVRVGQPGSRGIAGDLVLSVDEGEQLRRLAERAGAEVSR